ncbi:hypothetical protein FisN_26Hh070 [Fistulifera solaris]|uniref:Non-structural maintenance of chromosomes element 1 homolog n=1 Tax=Fistulifera solaris TaxID=1519565 RepID=A0A1Z5JXM9_FISSO|nr:hypothetical protein FisN_26Hh070 [Fistulifera solaris]|eukprot:GAX18773.1 hypothetical protein FisN_26Hh070 [Fistulifera solaris]
MVEPLSIAQKMFNQRLLAEHSMTHEQALQLWESLHSKQTLEDSLIQTNRQLKYIGLQIVGIRHNNVLHLCLIRPTADDVTKGVGQYPIPAHNYTRLVLKHVVEHGETKLTDLKNLRLELQEGNLDLSKAEEVLHDLVEQKWLHECGNNKVDLAPRAYAELSSLFTQEFGMEKEDLPQQIFYA